MEIQLWKQELVIAKIETQSTQEICNQQSTFRHYLEVYSWEEVSVNRSLREIKVGP